MDSDHSRIEFRFAAACLLVSMIVKLALASWGELLPEEAYYWSYAQHLAPGYLDHPPGVAWLIAVGTSIAGQTEFGVRLGALLCGLCTSIYAYRITALTWGRRPAWVVVGALQVLPFFFTSSFLMTPDAPVAAAWAAGLYYMYRMVVLEDRSVWLPLGIVIGLGLLSKYTILLLPFGAVVYAMLNGRLTALLRAWQIYAAAAVALALFSPVLYWNATHDWASFSFQTSRRLAEAPRFSLHKLLGSVLVLVTPLGFAALARIVRFRTASTGWADQGGRFLLATVLVPLIVFTLFSLRHEVKLDWTGPVLLGLVILVCGLATGEDRQWRWLRSSWPVAVVLLLSIYSILFVYLARGLPGMGYSASMELFPVGWRALGESIRTEQQTHERETGRPLVAVGMDRYELASELSFYARFAKESPRLALGRHFFGQPALMFETWNPIPRYCGIDMIVVAWSPVELSGRAMIQSFTTAGPIHSASITVRGRFVRTVYFRQGFGYRCQLPL